MEGEDVLWCSVCIRLDLWVRCLWWMAMDGRIDMDVGEGFSVDKDVGEMFLVDM